MERQQEQQHGHGVGARSNDDPMDIDIGSSNNNEQEVMLQKKLQIAAIEIFRELTAATDSSSDLIQKYPNQINDLIAHVKPIQESDTVQFDTTHEFFRKLYSCTTPTRPLQTSFSYKTGYLSGYKVGMKFSPHGYYIFWETYTAKVAQKQPPFSRSIRRWVPSSLSSNGDGNNNYAYFTWCGILADNKEFEKDVRDRMEQKLQDLANELSFEEVDYGLCVGY